MIECPRHRRHYGRRQSFLAWLKDRPCLDCGNCFPPECMDFDHVRRPKVRGVGLMATYSMEAFQREVMKCDLVCSNCHRVRTTARKRQEAAA